MHLTAILSTVLGALAVVARARATTLVTSARAPLGGRLQALVDGSRVPTAPGVIAVDLHACPGSAYDGCWDAAVLHLPATRGVDVRWPLIHELGHVRPVRLRGRTEDLPPRLQPHPPRRGSASSRTSVRSPVCAERTHASVTALAA
jgi:hypothetical protein